MFGQQKRKDEDLEKLKEIRDMIKGEPKPMFRHIEACIDMVVEELFSGNKDVSKKLQNDVEIRKLLEISYKLLKPDGEAETEEPKKEEKRIETRDYQEPPKQVAAKNTTFAAEFDNEIKNYMLELIRSNRKALQD